VRGGSRQAMGMLDEKSDGDREKGGNDNGISALAHNIP